ncbi:MAG: NrfD/PsrC family molybdoenzyme membrane anchor subunit [Sandaracinaceae bacterium]
MAQLARARRDLPDRLLHDRGAWWALETAAWLGWVPAEIAETARPWLLWSGLPFAVGAAVYTAFLFGQAEGRDLWQSPLLPGHLVIQAAMMGGAALLAMGAAAPIPEALLAIARWTLAGGLALDLFVTLLGEVGMSHASEVAARAAHSIVSGKHAKGFWLGSVGLGHVIPLGLLILPDAPLVWGIAGLAAAIGLYFYEHAFVMAPQEVRNS